MADSTNGNAYLPFTELMRLDKIDEHTFRSTAMAFAPGGGNSAYGGHVYSQAVWAASQTVEDGFTVHNVTGWFTLPGDTTLPFIYHVRTIRDGRGYCTRGVDVVQEPDKGVCFTCIASFKRAESSPLDRQEAFSVNKEYSSVLSDHAPADHPEAPSVDSPWYWAYRAGGAAEEPFPGLSVRKVDMAAYNSGRAPLDRRQLHYYRVLGAMPPLALAPNLHLCAHLYASDRNSLFIIANNLDVGDGFSHMASLSHTVVFHTDNAPLAMTDDSATPVWFCQEAWSSRAAGGRALHLSRIWDAEDRHLASTWQEGLLRVGENKYGKMRLESLEKRKRGKL